MATSGTETQPRIYQPTLRGILSLPFRICNPPPAVGKVRSCSVTPLMKIRLEDILDRKHIPPLGLKDFEEWLLYVEMAPENLYFILWLKEYTAKYQDWAADSKIDREMARRYRVQRPTPNSSQLAMFYARAKQTFFIPNAAYELDVPSHILAPFHAPDSSQHPDPMLFNEISHQVHQLLERSLDRFVRAQLNNVGTNRVLCGIVAGVVFCLSGSIAPIVVNLTRGYSRWNRLAAFPGLWFGLTVLLAALNGICLSVYVLGDLRQLHRFELARPSISQPQHLRMQRQRPSISLPLSAPPPPSSMVPVTPAFPPAVHVVSSRLSRTSTRDSRDSRDDWSSACSSTTSSHEAADMRIEISAAYYDTDPVDEPATSPITQESDPRDFPSKVPQSDRGLFTTTATFIHPYDSVSELDFDCEVPKLSPDQRQPVSAFDFDALPARLTAHCKDPSNPTPHEHGIVEITTHFPPLARISPKTVMERIQLKCNLKKRFIVTRDVSPSQPTLRSSLGNDLGTPTVSVRRTEKGEYMVRKQFKAIKAVPAFASLTRVLSPIVIRGQWEIVVRSSIISFILTWVILGSLLAVPIVR